MSTRTIQMLADELVTNYEMSESDAMDAVVDQLQIRGYTHTAPTDPVDLRDFMQIRFAVSQHYLGR